MKKGILYTCSSELADIMRQDKGEYSWTTESLGAGFSGADIAVIDLYDVVNFKGVHMKLYAFFKSILQYSIKENESSNIVIIPSGLGYKEECYLYLLQGMIKSFACELARYGSRLNCIECCGRNNKKIAEIINFLGNERAYITAQILQPDFFKKNIYIEKKEKIVLITGAGQGIGAASAREFARLGYKVCINDVCFDKKIEKILEETNGFPAIGDISDKKNTDAFIDEIINKYGKIDVFVANAAFMHMESLKNLTSDDLNKHVSININGHLACLEKVISIMKRQGGGRIILFSSMFGTEGWENAVSYAGTKAAMIGLGQYLSKELKIYGISVVIIAPGVVDTPQLQVDADNLQITLEEVKKRYCQEIPIGRIGKAEEIAYLVGFLGHGGADYFSGKIIQSNGGEIRSTPERI